MYRNVAAALALGAVMAATPAEAQMAWQGRGFATVNFGMQNSSETFSTLSEPEIYDELARISSSQKVESGPVFDISGAVRVWRNLAVGVGVSRFGDSFAPTVTAAIPHPLVFDSPRTATASTGDLDHQEIGVHVTATWMIPVTEEFEVGVFAGPSFYSVKQEFVRNIGFSENGAPFDTITLGSPEIADESESAVGINLGGEVTYLATRRLGVNAFLRYAGATAKFEGIEGGEIKVGGLQYGVGLRVRF